MLLGLGVVDHEMAVASVLRKVRRPVLAKSAFAPFSSRRSIRSRTARPQVIDGLMICGLILNSISSGRLPLRRGSTSVARSCRRKRRDEIGKLAPWLVTDKLTRLGNCPGCRAVVT
jgi:hypothetical protein